jgi:hypothetical protein
MPVNIQVPFDDRLPLLKAGDWIQFLWLKGLGQFTAAAAAAAAALHQGVLHDLYQAVHIFHQHLFRKITGQNLKGQFLNLFDQPFHSYEFSVLISLQKTGPNLEGHCSSPDSNVESGEECCVYWTLIAGYLEP